jgi:hypothetical protein
MKEGAAMVAKLTDYRLPNDVLGCTMTYNYGHGLVQQISMETREIKR